MVRTSGQTFLLQNGVPGDRIAFIPGEKRRGAMHGDLVEVIEASVDRISPLCPVASQCGGCAMQFVNTEKQADIKSGWVDAAFDKITDSKTLLLPAETIAQHGRRRLRWYVGSDEQGLFLGFRVRASHAVIRHERCHCATAPLNRLRQQLEATGEIMIQNSLESVQVVELYDGIHLILEGVTLPACLEIPFHEIDGLPIQWWQRSDGVTRPLCKPVQSFHDLLPAGKENAIELQVGPDDFIQGQAFGNCQIIEQLFDWSEGARFVVDLFSGIGNLSLPVAAAYGSRVIGAELNSASVRAANANAKRLGLNAEYIEANLFERFDVEPFAGADLLILDPPRRGAKRVCSMMGSLLPAKIVMVNCDAASGGRDGEMLRSLGYRLHTLRALDLFPYTGHVEAMSLWVR